MPNELINRIKRRLQSGGLPGQVAQLSMAHALRTSLPAKGKDYRRAAVMGLFYPDHENVLRLIFIVRTSHDPRDKHAGQIAYPGGSVDPTDLNLEGTALREVEEEIGVLSSSIEVLGQLTDLYIPVSNFLVSPFLGYMPQRPSFIRQESEVAEILELPFESFLTETARQKTDVRLTNGQTLKNVPCWIVDGHMIWGATSMITAEVVALAK